MTHPTFVDGSFDHELTSTAISINLRSHPFIVPSSGSMCRNPNDRMTDRPRGG